MSKHPSAKVYPFPCASERVADAAQAALTEIGASADCAAYVRARLAGALEGVTEGFTASAGGEEGMAQLQAWIDAMRGRLIMRLTLAYIELYERL